MSRIAAAALLTAGVVSSGYAVLCLLARGRRLPGAAVVGLAVAIGAGATSYEMFLLSVAGLRPGIAAVSGLCAAALLVLWVLARRSNLVRIAPPNLPVRRHEWALAVLVALPCAWLAADALRVPLHNIDAIAIWGLKAKVLAHETVRSSAYFHDPALSYSHQDYPLLVPFLTATTYGLRGATDEPLGKLANWGVFGALVLLVYAGVRRNLSRPSSLVLLVLFVLSPSVLSQASGGLADPALMLYYAGSVVFLLAWLETDDTAHLRIGCLLTAFLLFTKNEGTALAAIHLAVFGLAARRSRGTRAALALASHAALVVLLMLPWFVFRAGLPKTHENYGALLRPARIVDQIDRVPEILGFLGRTLVDLRLWGGLWLLLPIAWLLASKPGPSRAAGVLWACLACHLAVYVLILVVTPWDVRELLSAKAYPLSLQASPVLLLLLSVYWGTLMPPMDIHGGA